MPGITFKSYKRRDGELMLYINRSNGVSIGISQSKGFYPYGAGTTEGMRNVMNAAYDVIDAYAQPFTGDIKAHKEVGFCAPVELANGWVMVGTDVGNIGGHQTGGDGHFLIVENVIIKMGVEYDEPPKD